MKSESPDEFKQWLLKVSGNPYFSRSDRIVQMIGQWCRCDHFESRLISESSGFSERDSAFGLPGG